MWVEGSHEDTQRDIAGGGCHMAVATALCVNFENAAPCCSWCPRWGQCSHQAELPSGFQACLTTSYRKAGKYRSWFPPELEIFLTFFLHTCGPLRRTSCQITSFLHVPYQIPVHYSELVTLRISLNQQAFHSHRSEFTCLKRKPNIWEKVLPSHVFLTT
jgi:hypothetical protein